MSRVRQLVLGEGFAMEYAEVNGAATLWEGRLRDAKCKMISLLSRLLITTSR